jgi:hemoglobin/transferrin/lactoferrin receptor protein
MNNRSPHRSYWYDKNIFIFVLILMLGLALIPGSAVIAQDEGDKEEKATQEEADEEAAEDEGDLSFFGSTSVTATGSAVDTHDIPQPVIVITAERIERIQPDSATDLLRNEPGVDVNGVGPNQTRPVIRGQRGHRVLFLQNGLRMNNTRRQTDFGEITGLVDVSNIETVEVVRGAGSVLYGSDAVGGVVNLLTKVPASGGRGVGGSLGLRYSSADEQTKVDVSVSGQADKVSYSFGVSTRDAEDYEAPSGSFGDIDLAENAVVNGTGVEDDSYFGYLGYRMNDKHSIFFRGTAYSADQAGFGYVDPSLIGDTSGLFIIDYPFHDFERYTFGYSAGGMQEGFANTVDVSVYTQNNERDNGFFADINIGPAFGPPGPNSSVIIDSLIFSDVETVGLRAEATKAVGENNLLTYGVEFYEDDITNTRGSQTTTILRAVFPIDFICGPAGAIPFPFECVFASPFDTRPSSPNSTNTGSGIFLQNAFYVNDRFTATLGARFAKSETTANATQGWDISGLDFSDDDLVYALNLVYAVNDEFNLVGSFGTAFRAPNVIERLFNGLTPEGAGFQILNPGLTSEESENFDFGFKYRSRNAFFEAVYFDNEVSDAIIQHTLTTAEKAALPADVQAEVAQAGVNLVVQQRHGNVFTICGIELSGGYAFDNGFALGGNFTKLDGKSDSGDAIDPTGDTFSKKFNGYVRYDQPNGRFWAEYRVRRNGEEDMNLDPGDTVFPIGPVLPSFTIHDLMAGVTLFDGSTFRHTLGVVVSNLTDELYSEFSNATSFRPQSERNVIVSYRLTAK